MVIWFIPSLCHELCHLSESRASDLLEYVPKDLKIASLDIEPAALEATELNAMKQESDLLRTAKGLFWSKEFARATFVLKDCISAKARFMALYTQFLVRTTTISIHLH
jgi:anaphase-promoting complex subunit 8